MPSAHTVSVLLDDALETLNRAVGTLRRRNLPVDGLTLLPSGTAGSSRLTFVIKADRETADRVVQQFNKIIGVREVVLEPAEGSSTEVQR